MVAAAHALRNFGEHVMMLAEKLWKDAFGHKIELCLYEDNEATYRILKSGKNPTMKSLPRTHGISLAQVHECVNQRDNGISIRKCEGTAQRADIFTKVFVTARDFNNARRNVNIFSEKEFNDIVIRVLLMVKCSLRSKIQTTMYVMLFSNLLP